MVEMIKLEMSKFELMALGINHARHAYLSFYYCLTIKFLFKSYFMDMYFFVFIRTAA